MLPLATHCHTHNHVHPFYFVLFKYKVLVAKQHLTSIDTQYTAGCHIEGYKLLNNGNVSIDTQHTAGCHIEGDKLLNNGNVNSSYIPQMEQHEPEGRMLLSLGNVTYWLDVTPSNPLPHPLPPVPILLRVI